MHALLMVYLDFNPANILIQNNNAYLIDFGFSLRLHCGSINDEDQVFMGTNMYASPTLYEKLVFPSLRKQYYKDPKDLAMDVLTADFFGLATVFTDIYLQMKHGNHIFSQAIKINQEAADAYSTLLVMRDPPLNETQQTSLVNAMKALQRFRFQSLHMIALEMCQNFFNV